MTVESPFDEIDARIEDLHAKIAGCRQTILVTRAAVALGGAALLAACFLYSFRTAPIILGAIAAMIGGVVWGGASGSSKQGLVDELLEAEAEKAEMIDAVAIRNGWRDLTPTVH